MRPKGYADLDPYQVSPVTMVTVDQKLIDYAPEVAAQLYATMALMLDRTAEDESITFEMKNGSLMRTKSTSELINALGSAQRMWDDGERDYELFQDEGRYPKYDYSMSYYCKREGIEMPAKPESTD